MMNPLPSARPSPAPGGALVVLQDVHKTYQMGAAEVHALAGVSISIPVGGFWAIMGPSGSGKSTMLNVLGCLDRPTRGRYVLNGENVDTLDDDALSEIRLRELGFIFQSFNLIPQLTVEENIELPLYYQGGRPAGAPTRRQAWLKWWDSATGCDTAPPNCPADSSRESPLPGHWPTTRRCCWPTSRRATWTP